MSFDDFVAAYEAGARAAADAAVAAATAAFKAMLEQRHARRGTTQDHGSALQRYREGSWKYDVLRLVYRLTKRTKRSEFRFSDLARYEAELRERHPDQKALMSGVNVTLQSLVKDGVLRRTERGRYHVV
ncbi:MAG: hypothetical protein JOZ86_01010 [Candidatus Eremiobacteraeota bacterium]|nr:hypothetical protein [Candidatus Eremiobacteraeota bacterium]